MDHDKYKYVIGVGLSRNYQTGTCFIRNCAFVAVFTRNNTFVYIYQIINGQHNDTVSSLALIIICTLKYMKIRSFETPSSVIQSFYSKIETIFYALVNTKINIFKRILNLKHKIIKYVYLMTRLF